MFNIKSSSLFRYLARFCDYCIFYLLVGAVTFALPYFYSSLFYYVLAGITPLLFVPVEALLLSRFAVTPGKLLFGLSVYSEEGTKLSYREALKWACLFWRGAGRVYHRVTSLRRKLCAFLTSSAFALAALFGNALALWTIGFERGDLSGWVQYTSEEAGFTVSFPKDPEETSKELVVPETGKVLNYAEVTSQESRKVVYSVSHMKLPGKWRLASSTTLLKGVLDLLVQHTEGAELLGKQFTTHPSGHRVLDYRMQQGKDEIRGRLIVVSGVLYKLTVVYPSSKGEDPQILAFLNSFQMS